MAFSITGLISGLDTAQIVSDMMDVERIPYTNLGNKKTNLQTEQSVFRSVNTKLKSLENILSELKFSTNLNNYKATSSSSAVSIGQSNVSSSAIPGTYSIKVEQVAKSATTTVSGNELLDVIKNQTFSIGDLNFNRNNPADKSEIADPSNKTFINNSLLLSSDISDEEKIKNIVSYINSQSSVAGATATMIKDQNGNYQVQFVSNSSNNVNIQNTGVLDKSASTTGKPAIFSVNGFEYQSPTNNIENVIPGVTFAITGSTGADISDPDDESLPVSIVIGMDTDKIVTKIKSFVDAYNDVMSLVRTNLAKPDEEGIVNPLQSDSILKNINSQLYSVFNEFTSYGFMEDIGLSIDKGARSGSTMTGLITFDETTFVSQLTSNPSKVSKILELNSTQMADTIYKSWTSSIYGVLTTKITGYDAQIKQIDERLEAMERSLEMKEARLKLQFSNMETIMSSLQSTQSWLTSQFEALTNSSKK